MATKQDIRNEGFRRGQAVASWVDMPEIGANVAEIVGDDRFAYVMPENRYKAWELLCYAAETNNRLNDDSADRLTELASSKPYDVWEVFEAGIRAGIAAYGRRHHAAALANAKQEG